MACNIIMSLFSDIVMLHFSKTSLEISAITVEKQETKKTATSGEPSTTLVAMETRSTGGGVARGVDGGNPLAVGKEEKKKSNKM